MKSLECFMNTIKSFKLEPHFPNCSQLFSVLSALLLRPFDKLKHLYVA